MDAESIALFEREGLDASLTNVWRIEVDPASKPNATLRLPADAPERPDAPVPRGVRCEGEVEAPPAAWGW